MFMQAASISIHEPHLKFGFSNSLIWMWIESITVWENLTFRFFFGFAFLFYCALGYLFHGNVSECWFYQTYANTETIQTLRDYFFSRILVQKHYFAVNGWVLNIKHLFKMKCSVNKHNEFHLTKASSFTHLW